MKNAGADVEVIIADNHSTDGSDKWIASEYPACNIVRMDQNYGYCGGNNRAAKSATGDILIFLNNDVEVSENWLQPLDELFRDPAVQIAQPKLLSVTRPHEFEYAGASGGFIDRLGYPFCRGRLMNHLEADIGQYDDAREVFWASGAAFAIRKDTFFEMGGFDESFEFHMEEIDLCWRVHHEGGLVMAEPKSIVWHYGGGSLPAQNPRKIYYNFRNSLYMLTKNASGPLFPKIIQRLVLDGLAGLQFLLKGQAGFIPAILRAHFHYYSALPSLLQKRKALQERHPSTIPSIRPGLIYHRLIPLDVYLRKKRRFSELDFE